MVPATCEGLTEVVMVSRPTEQVGCVTPGLAEEGAAVPSTGGANTIHI